MQGQPESQVEARQILMERISLYERNALIDTGKSRDLALRIIRVLYKEEFESANSADIKNTKNTKKTEILYPFRI